MAGLFGFFDFSKEGKGVFANEPPKDPITNFFSLLGRKFWKIIKVNLLYVAFSLPVFIVAYIAAAYLLNSFLPEMTIQAYADILKSSGATIAEGYSFEGYAASQLSMIYIVLGFMLTGLSLVVTGPVHAGVTYIMRNYSREEHAYLWLDFKEHARKNLKQSIVSSLISLLVSLALIFDLGYFFRELNDDGLLKTILMTGVIIIIILWCIIQMYLYPMMVTFDLPLRKLYKNSLLFAFIRLPVNLLLLLCSLCLVLAMPFALIFWGNQLTVIAALIWYLFIAFGVNLFLTNFFIYRGLDKYMLQRIKKADERPIV